jgi:hypothetical protein
LLEIHHCYIFMQAFKAIFSLSSPFLVVHVSRHGYVMLLC